LGNAVKHYFTLPLEVVQFLSRLEGRACAKKVTFVGIGISHKMCVLNGPQVTRRSP
jgi:hypothetical protein